ncbi:MAG: hypothetical protein JXM69_13785 [Anaerolineae bacterium]|nr:hypothetical protein [Anaerolineae bacterium]
MMPPALWLIVLPVGAVPVVYFLRKTWLGVIVAAGVAAGAAWLALQLPPGLIVNLLGRPVELDRLSQITLALLFAAAALLFLIAFPFAPSKRNQTTFNETSRRGQTFHPVGLATLGVFVAASISGHLGITAILIEVAVVLAVFIIQGRRLESTRAAQRFLVTMSLALPLFLLAAWRIDQYQLGGGIQPATYLVQTAMLVGFGFALWLAVFPCHSWLTTLATEATPSAAALGLITFPLVTLSILMRLLADQPWLTVSTPLAWAMVIAGGGTALAGGILASVQRGFSPLLGYTALYDLGCLLAVLGLGGEAAVITLLVGLTVRALALILIAACLVTIQLHTASDGFAQITGLARRLPVATVGLALAGLTLAGTPLTIGFPLRWQLLQSVVKINPIWPVLLTLAGLGVAIGYLRGLKALLQPATANKKERPSIDVAPGIHEPLLLVVIISLLGTACVVFGLFPSLLIEPLQKLSMNVPIPIR